MAQIALTMPKMGESIIEATILNWVKNVGDEIAADETVLEIATDKVDSEVPSPVAGKLVKILHEVDSVVAIGDEIALIETSAPADAPDPPSQPPAAQTEPVSEKPAPAPPPKPGPAATEAPSSGPGRFYSPLVKSIAKREHIARAELDQIPGSGKDGRVTKRDMEAYLKRRDNSFLHGNGKVDGAARPPSPSPNGDHEIIEMDRMRRLIAKHMVDSKRTSPHVTSFIEVDVTPIVNWRNGIKKRFQEQHGQKITFTPIFLEAVARALKYFPLVNVSVDGDRILKKHNINLGMATALPNGNLIVPVIKNADRLNLMGLTEAVNDLAARARAGQLKPADTQDGTFTLTNVGTFGNVMGTPIINQPQVAILAVGAIQKKPAVLETEYGDVIAIRHKMFMSLSYDHRVVDGFLGGSFLRRIGDYLEGFDTERTDV